MNDEVVKFVEISASSTQPCGFSVMIRLASDQIFVVINAMHRLMFEKKAGTAVFVKTLIAC